MKCWILSVGVVLFLAACGSTVPLNDVPVADATPKIVSGADTQTGTGAGTVVQSGGVAPVDRGGGGGAQASLPGESRSIYFESPLTPVLSKAKHRARWLSKDTPMNEAAVSTTSRWGNGALTLCSAL